MATETLKVVITADNKQAVDALKKTSYSLDELKGSLKATKAELQTLTDRGAISATNSEIRILKGQIKELEGDAAKSANAFTKGFSALRQMAYILPGIGIAGIFNLAFEAVGHLVTGLDSATKKMKEFSDAYLKAMVSADEHAQKEISTLGALVRIAGDESLSRQDRKRALDELNDKYPQYFKNLSTDISDSEHLKAITDQLTGAIIRKANAEALAGLVAKENAKIWEAEHQTVQQQVSKLDTWTKAWDYFKAGVLNGNPALAEMNSRLMITVDSFKEKNDVVKQATSNVKSLTEEINKNTLAQIQNNDFALDGKAPKEKKKKKEKDPWAAYKKRMQEELDLEFGTTHRKDPLFKPPEDEKPKVGKMPEALDFDNWKKNMAYMKKVTEDQARADKEYFDGLTGYAQYAADAFGNLYDAMEKGIPIGEAIGDMFKNIANDIAKAAIKAAVFKVLLDVISGGASEGAKGFGFLDIFKGMLGLGKGKAEGGISSGPKSGYLELLHGTEAIFPMDKLADYTNYAVKVGQNMGGGTQNITVTGRLSGNDIWLSQKRTDYFRGLTV